VEEEQAIAEALKLAERIGKKATKLSVEEEIDIQVMITALVWAAIGLGIKYDVGSMDSLRLGLHLAIESALEELEEDKTLH
jgi:hypothetical protein